MKTIYLCFALLWITAAGMAQVTPQTKKQLDSATQHRFTDLSGQPVQLRYNADDKLMYDRNSNKPIDFFINSTGDTISSNGYVVNSYLLRGVDNRFTLDTSKIQMRGDRVWGREKNKELMRDKNWKQYERDGTKSGVRSNK